MERQRQRESSILVYMVAYHIKHHMQHTAVCVPLSSPPPPVLSHLVTIEVTVKDVQRAVVALVVHVRREVLQLDADLITVVVLAALELSVANREIEIGIWVTFEGRVLSAMHVRTAVYDLPHDGTPMCQPPEKQCDQSIYLKSSMRLVMFHRCRAGHLSASPARITGWAFCS